MTSRDLTIGAVRSRLEAAGYAITSATHPDRFASQQWRTMGQKQSLEWMADHPAAIVTYPSAFHCQEFKNVPDTVRARGLVLMTLTAYLAADPRQLKAVITALERYKLTSGPYRVDDFGNRTYPLQWNADSKLTSREARRVFPDDDATVVFEQSTAQQNYTTTTNHIGQVVSYPTDEIGTFTLPLSGEWHGSLLDTPRKNLPELFNGNLSDIIGDVERARWGARPLLLAKEAA